MNKSTLQYAVIHGVALFCIGTASALPPNANGRPLSLVPPDASIVAQLTWGTEPSFLVLTRNNTIDWADFESISGVDPTRRFERAIFIARDREGLISEHSLLTTGHFDMRHIFKAAMENGAAETEYLGIPVLIVRPLDRDMGISRDVRWLAFIDPQTAVFGTVVMVQEELGRYLARSSADASLMRKISELRSTDQSWCVLTPTVYNQEIVRRTLAAWGPGLEQPRDLNVGLILGIHFGRGVEIEYESVPNYANSNESGPETQVSLRPAPAHQMKQPGSSFLGHDETRRWKVISLSKKQYGEFIERQQALESLSDQSGRKEVSTAESRSH